jgi:hypothetical protein
VLVFEADVVAQHSPGKVRAPTRLNLDMESQLLALRLGPFDFKLENLVREELAVEN